LSGIRQSKILKYGAFGHLLPGKNVSKQYYIGGKTLLVYKLTAEGFTEVKFMLYLTNFQFKIIASARLT
jgi:hypothetical protein